LLCYRDDIFAVVANVGG